MGIFSLVLTLVFLLAASFPDALASQRPCEQVKSTLSSTARLNTAGFANILEADRARATFLKSTSITPRYQGQAWNREDIPPRYQGQSWTREIVYTFNVGIGSPPSDYTLIIDTGSSNTWIGAAKPYEKTQSSILTGEDVHALYPDNASFSGSEFLDTVAFAGLVITNQSIGVADISTGFGNNIDGILGLGPVGLTDTTSGPTIPTVMDNLFANHIIYTETICIFFTPLTVNSDGGIFIGILDTSEATSPVHFVPITATEPSSAYWGIDLSISFGGTTILTGAGIVATRNPLIMIATDAFAAYQQATGGVWDPQTGLLSITHDQFEHLKPLDFYIGGKTFSLIPDAQIWPPSLNSWINGSPDLVFLLVADIGSPSGNGFDFILGSTFLQRFFSVYDTTNKQVGFATTKFTNVTTNWDANQAG